MNIYQKGLWAVTLLCGMAMSCEKEKSTPPPVVTPPVCDSTLTFSGDIQPILTANCNFQGCHGNGSAQSGVSLENHASVVTAIENKSFLESIKQNGSAPFMPPAGGKLDDAEIFKIECWINDGMPNN